ncbi:MAG: GNAT family N-acetyltransferase, partial [Lachnospiraceae bacterium]|nr:GNAT family N-acetyltransferase [Lachnospiraceae bacterium]
MLYLKELNMEDLETEYEFFSELLEDENGFTYSHVGASYEEFCDDIVPTLMDHSRGINLPENFVPCTEYLLWDDNRIVGLFRMRHVLNDFLRQYHGHIGYMIRKSERGKGYGSRGLALLLDMWRHRISEDAFYLSVHRDNPASLQVQKKCG